MDDALAMNWRCYDCNMTFSNPSLLQKHRARFCVGGGLGDPDQLMLRRGFRSELGPEGADLPDDPDVPRYNHQTDPKAQQLAESHGRNMEHLQNRNRDLERQREEIRRRLEDLGRRPIKDDDSMNALLQELKDQEARNQKMLEELRRLMATQYNYPIPVEGKKQQQYVYPIYYGNSLVAEIIAVRQAYLQNGGSDPSILQQLAQMQAEAQAIDDSLRNRPPGKVKDKHHPDHSLLALELENERLQRQLLLLQEQNLQARHRRKDDREGRARARATRQRAGTSVRQVQPLDTRYIKPVRPNLSRLVLLKEKPVTYVHSLKERIDVDVQNKYGYDLGTTRYVLEKAEVPVEKDVERKGNVSIMTMVPEGTNDVVGPRPQQKVFPETILEQNEDMRESPYYKAHLSARKLNLVEKELRDSYSRMSQPNVRGEDMDLLDRIHQQNAELGLANPDLKLYLDPTPRKQDLTSKNLSQFEDNYFANTTRTEVVDDGSYSKRARPQPHPRPQLLINDSPTK